jgi:hypothetical protein
MIRARQIAELFSSYHQAERSPPNPEKPGKEEIKVPIKLSVS